MNSWRQYFLSRIEEVKEDGLYRSLKQSSGLDFSSNDYLGFATDEKGSGGSRLLSGNSESCLKTEDFLAEFHGFEEALLFNSGYTANIGILSCLNSREFTFIFDELCHASIRDGLRLSPARSWSFNHNDLIHLEALLRKADKAIVVIESLYSMDGDTAPLASIIELCENHGALLIVDEAHAVGVFGNRGEGLLASQNAKTEIVKVVTFGKALGSHGAAVLCSEAFKEFLVNFSRPFIYTTAPSPIHASEIVERYQNMIDGEQRLRLRENIELFISCLTEKSNSCRIESNSAIQAFLVEGNDKVLQAAEELKASGISAFAIRYPTVSKGKERLRICLHAQNTKDEIQLLCKELNRLFT